MQAVQVMHLLSIGGLLSFSKDSPNLQLIRGTERVAAIVTVDVVVCAAAGLVRTTRRGRAMLNSLTKGARPIFIFGTF
jgi:hypothetical protein